ncbi:MAG TPA: CarD family transcriptional regulator, partial [Pyrinomonadaceae bacterium]|nr:CarD family transcriptional regulator [Pyrinomonadaceae bacterium]
MKAILDETSEIERLTDQVRRGARVISIAGLTSISAKAYVLAQLHSATEKRFAVVTQTNEELENWSCDLEFWLGDTRPAIRNPQSAILALPSFETDPYSGISPHAETQERRALTLWHMTREQPAFVIASARSLITRTLRPDDMTQLGAIVQRDKDFAPDELMRQLVAAGYVREEPIGNIGQFSLRGGIVDVWSPDAENPVRIEFFGDTVDSIREFDPETQLSTGQLTEIAIAPMREFAATPSDLKDWAFFAADRFTDERFARNLKDRTDFANEGEPFSGWEFLIALTKRLDGTAFDYLDDHVVVIDEPQFVEHALENFYENIHDRYTRTTDADDVALEPRELFLEPDELRTKLDAANRVELRALGRTAAAKDEEFALPGEEVGGDLTNTIATARASRPPLFLFPTAVKSVDLEIISRSTRKYHGDVREFTDEMKEREHPPMLAMETLGLAERAEEIMRQYDVNLAPEMVRVGTLSTGFEIPSISLEVLTETDIFGEVQHADATPVTRTRRKKSRLGAFISDFRDLKSGDYVVHVDHGIGRFDSLQTIEAGGMSREFMLLIYTDDAKLFVPVERLDLVSRYSSGEATAPTLDRLGGLGWQKTKAKAKRAMRDMADELLRLYAERKLVQGYAFSGDSPWQQEFEDAFPYDLTVDQASAIDDVKEDMETARPMDRLIIGDVGYGKTEVAMRAAFKAVMDGKQV